MPKLDTTLLLGSFAYLLYTTYESGLMFAFGTLISVLGVVLVGEYISLKKTNLWISDHIKRSNKKAKPLMALVVFGASLILHFCIS